jgi:phosphatidate cytidylyltransferase
MWEKFKDLKGRLLIHSVIIALASIVIYLSVFPLSKFFILLLVISVLIFANLEFLHLVKVKGLDYSIWLSLPMIIFWPTLTLFSSSGKDVFAGYVFLSSLSLLIWILNSFKKIENSINTISVQVFSHAYITIPLSFAIGILFMDSVGFKNDGRIWLTYLICVSKGADVGGYFLGSWIGKRPLAPKISPKKTVEGAVGAFIFSILISLAFYGMTFVVPKSLFSLSLLEALFLGFLVSLVSQLGDLSESLLKRDAKIKDSSSLPAVGGVLDILDSLIFTTPFLYCYLMMWR